MRNTLLHFFSLTQPEHYPIRVDLVAKLRYLSTLIMDPISQWISSKQTQLIMLRQCNVQCIAGMCFSWLELDHTWFILWFVRSLGSITTENPAKSSNFSKISFCSFNSHVFFSIQKKYSYKFYFFTKI